MGNRLVNKLKTLSKSGNKTFCAFVTLGYPNLAATESLITQFDQLGVDVVELGFPFSDPIADGPTIQYSSEKALSQGVTIEDAFSLASRLRRKGVNVPLIFFTYLNPVLQTGYEKFSALAKQAGFDGVIVPDLPIEEEKDFQAACRKNDIAQIYLVTPTTSLDRARKIGRQSKGFVYMVSLRGVTGARKAQASELKKQFLQFKKVIDKPILIGFGVSTPDQALELSRFSDGVIVGSAIIDQIRSDFARTSKAVRFVEAMVKSVKSAR